MKKMTWNFIVDCGSFIAMLGLITTGSIIKFVLPPGSGGRGSAMHGGHGGEHIKSLLSLGRHDWGEIHFGFAVALVTLITIHIVLHFEWIKGCCKKHMYSTGHD
jgi:uncharacterized protein DUF4405